MSLKLRKTMIPAYVNSFILFLICAIHIYWGFGGNWGLRESLPERNGSKAFQPGRMITLATAIIFGCIALFYLIQIDQLPTLNRFLPNWLRIYGLRLLAGIFLLRAVGDFHYVGFFKKVRNSRFAQLDTKFYSPLCLLLSINTLILSFSPSQP